MNAIGIKYNASLQRIVREVKRDIDAALIPVIKQYEPEYTYDGVATNDAWSDAIARTIGLLMARWTSPRVQIIAQRLAGDFVRASVTRSERDMKKNTGIDVFSGSQNMQEYLQASAQQNADLITSIPSQYLNEVSTLVMTNMRTGMRPGFIAKALQEQFGVTQRRAKFIARDQTSKIQGDLAEKQQRGAGFEYFEWLDSDDSRVRHRHEEIANRVTAYGKGIYRWDNLPLSDKGVPIKPGSDYACRCTARPVSAREVERNQREGKTNPSVLR